MIVDNVDCDGDESSLEYCDHGAWGGASCNHQTDAAGVKCQGNHWDCLLSNSSLFCSYVVNN